MVFKTTPKHLGLNLLFSLALLIPFAAKAQNEMAIGSTSTKANAILWLNGNGSQGLLLPAVTNKSAVSSPDRGLLVYDNSDNKIWYRNGSTWVEVGAGAATGGTVTSVTGTGAVSVTNSTTTPVISIANAGITNALIANDAVTSSKILNGTVTGADIADVTITANKLSQSSATTGQVLKWNGTNWVPQDDDTGASAVPILSNGQILVGNGLVNSAAALTGDATLASGVLTLNNNAVSGGTAGKITDGTITNIDIANAAAIAVTKLAIGTNGQVLTTVGTVPTWQTPAAAGTVTSVAAGIGLTGGPITSTGTLSVDVGTTANKIVQLDGTARLPAVDGSQLSGLNASNISAGLLPLDRITAGAAGQVLTTVAGIPAWQAPVTGVTTLDGLTDAAVAAPASGQILVNDGAGQFRNVSMSGDASISAAGALTIANGAISGGVGGKITDATIVAADLAAGSVSGGVGGVITDASVTNADISTTAAIAVSKVAAGANGNVLTTVAGIPSWQAPVTGATTLDGLTDATVAAPASGQILVNNGAGQFVNVNMSGDAGISNTGALTIANGAISGGVGGKITDGTIAAADLAAGSVSGGVGGIITDGTITTADITDATVTNADISGAAAIAVTKVAAGANGNVLTTVAGVPSWQAPVTGATTLDGLTDATVAAPASGQILVNNGAGQFVNVNMSGDATISNTGALTIANGAISGGVGGKITDASITSADLAAGAVSGGVGGIITDASVTSADLAASSISGGLGGVITDATVTNDDIAATAAIAVTKVAAGTDGDILTTVAGTPTWQAPAAGVTTLDGLTDATVAVPALGQLLVNDGAGQFRNVSMSGDAAISGAGALTITNGAISGGVGGKITDATITDADIAAAAAIAGTKISPDFGSQNMATTGTATVGGGVTVGAAGQFIVNGTGNITRINNLVTSFPAVQGVSGSLLSNDGVGNLTWTSPSSGWSLLGNAGTTPGTNFIGTTDANDLVFKTNNTENLRLTQAGNVGIGSSSPLVKLSVRGKLYVRGDGNTPSDGDMFTPLYDLTIDDNDTGFDVPNDGELAFLANGVEMMRVTTGTVGIGTATPDLTAKLHLNGSIKITDGTQGAGKVLTSDGNGFAAWQPAGAGSGWTLTGNAGTVDGTNFIGTTDAVALTFKVGNAKAGRIGPTDDAGVFFGWKAGETQVDGVNTQQNVGIGTKALWFNVSGEFNTAVGQSAMRQNLQGSDNVAVGQGSLSLNTEGNANTAVGKDALSSSSGPVADRNTAVGYRALFANTLGGNNTALGYGADVSGSNLSNATALGYLAVVNASNKVRIGNGSVSVIEGQVAFTAASDIRFKRDVRNIDAGLDFITKLRPVTYRMKNDDRRTNWGFIAQEIESLIGTENAVLTIGEDQDRTLGLRYSDFVAPLVKSVQELNAKIEQLEAENLKLKAKLSEVANEKEKLTTENGLLESKVNTIQSDVDDIKRILSLKASKN